MPTLQATRFAQVSIQLYGQQGTFDIGFANDAELVAAAQAFEEIGCTVSRPDPHRLNLTITCPKPQ